MKQSYSFWIINGNGEMRNTANHHCTEEQRKEFFGQYQGSVKETYPDSFAAWQTGNPEKDIRLLKEEISNLKEEVRDYKIDLGIED